MISCTEFIPAYSELFAFLEELRGPDEVRRFWKYLFEPDGEGIPLIRFLEREGIRGCFSYWAGTLNEEAADFTMYLNEPAGWFLNVMHRCPSKGRLLELQREIGLEPYHDYCLHCDSYRSAAEKAGFRYLYNFRGIENAACSMLIYDPKVFDGRVIVDENTEIMERRASQNEYFHRDFHSSLNMGVEYLGSRFGEDALRAYLTRYVRHVYRPLLEAVRARGLPALEEHIRETYRKEKAPDAVETALRDGTLEVRVRYCPAVRHLRETGRRVSAWFPYTTGAVMEAVAGETGLRFEMERYDPDTGAAAYRFSA